MLGFADVWVALAYLLSLGAALLCVAYGILRWNQDDEMPEPVHPQDENLEFEETI
jgi:hypothetical protein